MNFWPWIFGLLGLAMLALAGYQTYCYITYLRNARRRRRKNTHGVEPLTIIFYAAAAVLLLLAFLSAGLGAAPADPSVTTEPTTDPTGTTTEPPVVTGWVDDGDSRYYMLEDGSFATGWMEMDGRTYYFQSNGLTLNGWHEVDGIRRYFRADGSMARGEEEIDGVTHFFTASGAEVELVSPAHPLQEGYAPELVELSVAYASAGVQIDVRIQDDLIAMMKACNAYLEAQQGTKAPRCCVTYGYQDPAKLSEDTAATSEHLLGLAVDIVDTDTWKRDPAQPVQQWLEEHSWEYGFILRYPEGKADVTGVEAQTGHYRYVGLELAAELHNSGLTLEEYLNALD